LEETGRALAAELSVDAGQAFAPLRVAVTGSAVSPPLFATMRVLGRERVLGRLAAAVAHLG
jgi:glutamyl-tRNA synthetase